MQPDTIIPDPSASQGWNRYSYVDNNPVRFNDPTGHKLEEDLYKTHGEKCKSGDLSCNWLEKTQPKLPNRPRPDCHPREACRASEQVNKVDLMFDPFHGPYMDDLENGSLSLDQLENIDDVWNSANYAYIYNGINLGEVAANAEINPLSTDEIYKVLTGPAAVEMLLIDRSAYKPYGWFLRLLGEQTNENLLITSGSEQSFMQFEPNYLYALMEAHPMVLTMAKATYQENFADEFVTDYSGDLIEEFLNKYKLFGRPSIVP